MSSLKDENRDLRKQIGCMNGIFQIFDPHHFLTGRRVSSKKLLQGGKHQTDQPYAKKHILEKGLEAQKEKPRISTESSRASFSSSSCSSTFSSLDHNRTLQPETLPLRQISVPESPFQTTTASKERQPSSTSGLRDAVKDSMHREVRSLSIKSQNSDERRGTVMKHIDSPRPLQQFRTEKPKATGMNVGKNSKDERLTLHRFSYDGRESRELYKSTMKHKELPRLSLDSKTKSTKALDSRSSFLMLNQEPESHNRTSSVVARLMGLEAFPDTTTTDDSRTPSIKSCTKEAFLSQLSSKTDDHKPNQVNHSPRVSQTSPASPSTKLNSVDPVRKPSRCPVEPAPWRQQDSSQGSPKMASKSRKAAATSILHQTSSVYGQIEKRITDLEFKKSGKDLRALKQILEAMQKTRARMEDQQGESAELISQKSCSLEESWPHHNSNLSMWNNKTTSSPKQFDTFSVTKPAKVMEKDRQSETTHSQSLQTRTPKYHRGSSAHIQKANSLTPENRTVKHHNRHLPSSDKKTSWSSPEPDRIFTITQRTKFDIRSSGAVSPRLQQNPLRLEGESGRAKKHGNKNLTEKGSPIIRNKVKTRDQQLSDDQLSELSSDTRYSSFQGDAASVISESNNSQVSHSEMEFTSMARSIKTNTRRDKNLISTSREHMPAVESSANMLEQPSPISVLDNAFYCEDLPSPVKKISTGFQDDESPSSEEAEWCLQNLNHLMDCISPNRSFKYNPKSENTRNAVQELTQVNKEPDGAAANPNDSLNPACRYINKILLTSGLLKGSSFISMTDKLFSSPRLINPDMFHVLEQTEEIREAVNGAVSVKSDKLKLDKRIQRKIIFDLVDEILVRKILSSRLQAEGKKRITSQGVLKEVHTEMERLSRTSDCNIELLTADMKHQSEDWVDFSGEAPALVLDVERMIFKDLINEVIEGEVMDGRNWPKRHCRNLFGK